MSFANTVKRLGAGRVLDDCEMGLAEVVHAVKATGGKGEVALKLKVEFNEDDGEAVSVKVSGEVKTKVPKAKRQPMIAFVRENGVLTTRDPRQAELPEPENMVPLDRAASS